MTRTGLPGVSLCMIVRNEEAYIETCLLSALPYVTEIIVCDTGSTDRTMAIAQSLGARVVKREWTDDFAAARNEVLSLASEPWILMLDADERLAPSAVEEWEKLLCAEGQWGYYLRLISSLAPTGAEREGAAVTDAVCRLFRNDARIRFAGIIHEECTTAVAALQGRPLEIAPLTILHEGYRSDVVERRRKTERNTRLLTKALVSNPSDPLLRYAAGTELLGAGRWLEAATWLQPLAGQLDDTFGFASDVYLKLSIAYRMAGHLDEAIEAAEAGLQRYADFPDLYEALAAVHMERDDARTALQMLQQAIAIGPAAPYYSTVEGAGGYRTMCDAGAACERLYEWRAAAAYYAAALDERPGLERAWVRLLALYQAAQGETGDTIREMWERAAEHLLALRDEAEAGGNQRILARECLRVAQLLLQMHETATVGPYIERLVEGTGEQGLSLLGWLRLQQGNLADAERCWSEARPCIPDDKLAGLQAVLDWARQGRSGEQMGAVSDEVMLLAGDWAGWWNRAAGKSGTERPLPHLLQCGAMLRGVEQLAREGEPARDGAEAAAMLLMAQPRIAGAPFAAELAAGLLAAAAGRWREACDCFAAARSAAAHPVQGRAAASALAAAFAARASEALAGGALGAGGALAAPPVKAQSLRCCSELRLIGLAALYPP
ncbi:hypothetical protein PCCS19_58830 [Paenibacillus sp. CCS19]|uniref:tetratricopeptide repeat-containing glycosyltransferase family 2 protein n=1 Tax=Paenibacillus sp. CCS19 TaxID=3158387 RepID=UPI0025665C16|nr:glycosyltransferase [Paenibacillus cellulosilyticus]GMK42823.1 hypothetical protein PCCS19_58830 [Paenibacillus cellulosilyticus]